MIHVILRNNFYSGARFGMFKSMGPRQSVPMPDQLKDHLPKKAEIVENPVTPEDFVEDEGAAMAADFDRGYAAAMAKIQAEADAQRNANSAALTARLKDEELERVRQMEDEAVAADAEEQLQKEEAPVEGDAADEVGARLSKMVEEANDADDDDEPESEDDDAEAHEDEAPAEEVAE